MRPYHFHIIPSYIMNEMLLWFGMAWNIIASPSTPYYNTNFIHTFFSTAYYIITIKKEMEKNKKGREPSVRPYPIISTKNQLCFLLNHNVPRKSFILYTSQHQCSFNEKYIHLLGKSIRDYMRNWGIQRVK